MGSSYREWGVPCEECGVKNPRLTLHSSLLTGPPGRYSHPITAAGRGPMSDRPIHWHEGMFLRPHHFQAADRHMRQYVSQQVRWDEHHYWGVRHLKHDPDALGAFRFVVRHLEARMRDGTPVVLPDDAG